MRGGGSGSRQQRELRAQGAGSPCKRADLDGALAPPTEAPGPQHSHGHHTHPLSRAEIQDLLPGILNQMGPDHINHLKKMMAQVRAWWRTVCVCVGWDAQLPFSHRTANADRWVCAKQQARMRRKGLFVGLARARALKVHASPVTCLTRGVQPSQMLPRGLACRA